ncbi:MAG: sulfite exporter TauE/SafE family protein [bacterium]
MSNEILVLMGTAASLGFLHTIFGPDHYLPFIMIARARRWSIAKTSLITFLCGLGHVGSSIVIGIIGVMLGVALSKIKALESIRGDFAAWMIIGFGFVYFIWGLIRSIQNKPHTHLHFHDKGIQHKHEHVHQQGHTHTHDTEVKQTITPWILFIIFIFGPCEPLIPILMYPAAKNSITGLILVTAVFGVVTILTMLTIVIAVSYGLNVIQLGKMERYIHPVAGLMICLSGLAIVFLGL